ncbi:MAG: type II toxin-antitoxin system VapC family toxin [Rhodoglobus sp.]
MRVLIDTHILLWMFRAPERISPAARKMLEDPHVDIVISAVTPFEIATKVRIGKLPGVEPVLYSYQDHLARWRADELAISSHHALVAGQLEWEHRDPFDRILAAQSITEGLPLVTSDPAFGSMAGVRVIWE